MVLEAIVNPTKVTGKPWEMFFIGAVYSLIGLALGYWVFRSYVSLVMVTFTAVAAIPFVRQAINNRAPEKFSEKGSLLDKYSSTVSMFTFLFLGFVAAFVVSFVFMPGGMLADVFKAQMEAIMAVRTAATGNFISGAAAIFLIILNNIKVLLFCLFFSLLYGAGAIFILSWNASVMGAAIGNAIRDSLSRGFGGAFLSVPLSLAAYFVHGLPEIIAYFIGGIAGGILSVSLMRDGFKSPNFRRTIKDSLNLVAFALITLVLAAFIEVFVSPNFL